MITLEENSYILEHIGLSKMPTKGWLRNGRMEIGLQLKETPEVTARYARPDVRPLFGIPDYSHRDSFPTYYPMFCAVHNGHRFEVVNLVATLMGGYSFAFVTKGFRNLTYLISVPTSNSLGGVSHTYRDHFEQSMELYFPLDPRITVSDIEGATEAYLNDDGDGWLFRHTDEGTHHDYELTLLAAVGGIFKPLFNQYQVDAILAANDEAKTRANDLYVLLSKFYGQVFKEAKKRARAYHLGERHQTPHPEVGYLDADITASLETVEADWRTNHSEWLAKLSTPITYLKRQLNMPTPETRWAKKARIEAEKKAAESEGG